MFCTNCGKKLDEGSAFCTACGTKIDNTQPVVTPVVNQQPVMPQQQPMMQQPVYQQRAINPVGYPNQQQYYYGQPKKKNSGGLIAGLGLIAIVAVLVFLVSGGTGGGSKKRTMMIYISASNLESEAKAATTDLASIIPSKVDLDNMNVIVYTGGTKKWHNFVSASENAIYELTKDGFQKRESYSITNMEKPETLASFLNYGYNNYKADKYDLIIYSHGGAWAGAISDDNFGSGMMSLKQFKQAFNSSPFNGDNKLEGIIFRTCLNGSYEVSTILKDYADYMVGSEEVTYGGTPINVLSFLNDISGEMDFKTVGHKFAESYYNNTVVPAQLSNVVMAYATIDLSKISNLSNEIGSFFDNLNVNTNYSQISRARSSVFQYALIAGDGAEVYDVVDLYNLVSMLKSYSKYDGNKLISAFNDAVVSCYTNSYGATNSKCMSIYFPYRGDASVKSRILAIYKDTGFNETYYKFINNFSLKQQSASTSSSMLELDNGHFTNQINITNKVLKLTLTEEEKNDISTIKYYVFKKNGNRYQEIKYGDDATLDGNNLTIDLTNGYVKLGNEYVSAIYQNKAYSVMGYATKGDASYKEDDRVKYNLDDKAAILNVSKKSSASDVVSYVVIDQDDYDKFYFTTNTYDKVDAKFKDNIKEENKDLAKDELKLSMTNLDSSEFYVVLEVRDLNNKVHYTSLNKIN